MARLMALAAPRRRMILTTTLLWLYLLILLLKLLRRRCRPILRRVPGESYLDRLLRGDPKRADFMYDATKCSNQSSLDTIRVNIHVFNRLCHVLVTESGLESIHNVPVDEMIVMFMWTLGHNTKNRILQKRFSRSGRTVCACIHAVLTAILKLHSTLYRKPVPVPEHSTHPYWKHFKGH
ncbi:hypothetical protein LINPERPRIM_LOCUS5315 [Linum perenne]